ALAVYGQRVVLDADIDVFLVDSRHFDFQCHVVLVFVDVDWWSKCGCGQRLILPFRPTRVTEQTVHAVLQRSVFAEWIPTGQQSHNENPPTGNSFGEPFRGSRVKISMSES